ncbi:outer membrane protein [Enterovirga sp. CN4-39]|uniref:outer membrane protein n=1 Tax=Enterovirga sp. CN4-39 TaxID=3400910 RepID=UPI003C102BFB
MKKVLLAGVALVALGSAAMAADLPSRRAPAPYAAPVPMFTWTGLYLGAQAGGVAGGDFDFRNNTLGAGPVSGRASVGGFVAGGQVGYNWQWGNVVVGIEGDVLYSDYGNSLSLTVPGAGTATARARADGFSANITGRVGYAFGRTLVYAKGGWAYLDTVRFSAGATGVGTFSRTTDMDGWTVGAGIEHAILDNVTLGVEYRYTQYGAKTVNFAAAPASVPVRVELDSHAVVGKLNWKFNSFPGL